MIIDEEVMITGNFNFTRGAEDYKTEKFWIIRSKGLASEYLHD